MNKPKLKTMLNLIPKTNQAAHVRIPSAPSNIAGQIFYTTDYGIFKELLGNRDIDENHVKHLIKSMKEEYLEIPIQVNQKMEVIDGQHRLAACKELGFPIYYTIVKGAGLEQTQRQNALSKKWSMIDVLDSYCKRGFYDYIKIKSYMTDYGLTLHQSLMVLNLNQVGGASNNIFRLGNFKVRDLNKSKAIVKDLNKLGKIVPITDVIIFRSFLNLLTKCEEFETDVFINKMQYQSQRFKKQRDIKMQLEIIEDIYNYRNRSKVNLRIIK